MTSLLIPTSPPTYCLPLTEAAEEQLMMVPLLFPTSPPITSPLLSTTPIE